jgi:uncharacterized protein involved in response to NO
VIPAQGAPSVAGEPTPSPWRREPFRLFFPLGVVLGWVGIGHWLLYSTGITTTYSCMFHGLVQTQAFLMAFAMGFLLTALPRRTQAAPPSATELWVAAAALTTTTVAAAMEAWTVVELGYVTQLLLLLRFAVRRFLGRTSRRRPPAAFVLIPFAFLHGLGGAGLLLAWSAFGAPWWTVALGKLLVEQGVFLCLVVGIGGLVLPLMAGTPPPPDLGSSPRERAKALAYGATGAVILASLLIEHAGWVRIGPLLRATVVAAGMALGGGAWRPPSRPGLHRRLVWIAVWLVPTGLALSGIWPDYRVPALHVLFIGGFSLLVFGVATHVAVSHLDMEAARDGSPLAIWIVGAGILIAMLGRFVADWSATYFPHLGGAAAAWLVASIAWLAFLGPKLVRAVR